MKLFKKNSGKELSIKETVLAFNEVFSAVDSCRKCGRCQSVCPVYKETGFEQHTARGKLLLLKGLKSEVLSDISAVEKRFRYCLLCGRCSSVCPAKIDTQSLIVNIRLLTAGLDNKSFLKKQAIKFFVAFPFFSRIFSPGYNKKIKKSSSDKSIIFFTGCLFDKFFYDKISKAEKIFDKLGYKTEIVSGECCGMPYLSAGDKGSFLKAQKKLASRFSAIDSKYIVSACPTCITALKKLWPVFSDSGTELNHKFEILDFHQFLYKEMQNNNVFENISGNEKIKWHLPCHLKSLGADKEAEYILEKLTGKALENESKINTCCGFGGTFLADHPFLSGKILDSAINELAPEKGESIVTGCPACMIQLKRACLNDKNILHTIDIVENKL
ncbi:MAG: (Fe-S)-binding protein [Thermodesulfobacteriota bacterium]